MANKNWMDNFRNLVNKKKEDMDGIKIEISKHKNVQKSKFIKRGLETRNQKAHGEPYICKD